MSLTLIDATGAHVYQRRASCHIALGNEREARPPAEAGAVVARRPRRPGDGRRGGSTRAAQRVVLSDGRSYGYDYLVLATGSRILPEAIEHFETEAHHFYTAEAAGRLRAALDAPSPAGRSSSASPACPTSARRRRSRSRSSSRPSSASAGCARQDRAPLLLADRARVHDRERVRDGHADPRAEGHRAPHVLQRRDDRSRAQGRPEPRGRGAALRPAHPRAAAQGPAVPHGLRLWRPPPAAGCRRIARPSRWAAGRMSTPSATPPTCRCRRRARRPISRRPS